MLQNKREHPKEKVKLHPRNRHRERYDFKQLIASCPELKQFVLSNKYNDESIDFSNPEAVKMLNRALLNFFYDIENWDIPQGYLVPPIPGRADYIHYMADVLGALNHGEIPTGNKVKCLDIGTGANCVYPIVGSKEYGWNFVGSDIDQVSIASANRMVESNAVLNGKVELRLQKDPKVVFSGIVAAGECFDLSICNPPFHASAAEANAATLRKQSNLKRTKIEKPTLNFGGKNNELWCDGGEERFLGSMIHDSKIFAHSCLWFSTLVSKESNLKSAYYHLNKAEATEVKTIAMGQGNKVSRIVAWTFLHPTEQQQWIKARW